MPWGKLWVDGGSGYAGMPQRLAGLPHGTCGTVVAAMLQDS